MSWRANEKSADESALLYYNSSTAITEGTPRYLNLEERIPPCCCFEGLWLAMIKPIFHSDNVDLMILGSGHQTTRNVITSRLLAAHHSSPASFTLFTHSPQCKDKLRRRKLTNALTWQLVKGCHFSHCYTPTHIKLFNGKNFSHCFKVV